MCANLFGPYVVSLVVSSLVFVLLNDGTARPQKGLNHAKIGKHSNRHADGADCKC